MSNTPNLLLAVMFSAFGSVFFFACQKESVDTQPKEEFPNIKSFFAKTIDLNNLPNYAEQIVPSYIQKDNFGGKKLSNEKALLGRVLFYDKNLSASKTVACASCHQQKFAFGDDAVLSKGVNGLTKRHSMRLVNARFANEAKFFWDKRAQTLEQQTTMPIRDHGEMGFSGKDGDPSFDDLIKRLSEIAYYPEFFKLAFGDSKITEERMQDALANFVRSIQSYDSKFDAGRTLAPNDAAPFPNFTNEENLGKMLFITRPQLNAQNVRTGGGLGCGGCHRAPEFDIDPATLSNGLTLEADGTINNNIKRSPSLRDVMKADGSINGGMMHTGAFDNFTKVLKHYGNIIPNRATDPRLAPGGNPIRFNLTTDEEKAIIAFMQTLAGEKIYKDGKWSDPFAQ